ncbi:uncharacterized protein LOC128206006 [Mya arenaria]|uniref:uncharacterized protein LOC128206006 n=1 Tax=Mya arenaria TaxID=6604 RepID=UPI0022E58CFF|nr:uncharacterized protein LOC128206006 [Mya arenaria]
MIELQKQMQDLLHVQMQQQRDLMVRQEKRDSQQKNCVKLPKLDLCPFNGDKLKWTQFWDAFECTVHDNKNLSKIEKFNYLQTKIVGEAKRAIAGLALSNENYTVAIDILKQRFGNPQEAVDLHYKKLMNMPAPNGKVDSLRAYLDTVEKHLRSLEVLHEDIEQHVFVSMIRSKLSGDVLRQIEFKKGSKVKWTVHGLIDALREYILACEHADDKDKLEKASDNTRVGAHKFQKPQERPQYSTYQSHRSERPFHKPLTSAETLYANVKGKSAGNFQIKCRYCNDRHWSDECLRYKGIEDRKKKLHGSCFKCLKEGHTARECKTKKLCVHCGEMDHHHRSLCPKKFGGKTTNVHLSEEIREDPSHNSATKGHVLISSDEMVLMQTAKASVGNRDTSVHETTRLLFDSGSQRTYITERLANKLGLKPTAEQELKLVTFGSEHTKVIKTKSVNIDITLMDGSCMKLTANVVPTISGTIQRNPLTKVLSKQMEHLINSVDLSDTIPRAQETTTIDVLIGNDYYLDIVLPQRIEIEPGLYLLSSKLGWILTGRLSEVESGTDTLSMFVLTHGTDITKQITFSSLDASIPTKPDLEDFWNIESIGIIDNVDKSDDDIAMRKFQDTVRFDDGRYQVTWPWREEDFELPSNRQLALGRLRSTVARMCKRPELFKKYNTVIEDQLEKGVIEKVNFGDQDGVVHYIPHHAVITPQKTTTKLRVVYDASSKTRKENHSLNECLYRGPVILQQLCGMLIRFRMHRIAITADIEKAFLQIGLQLDQRDVTRFLWLKNCETPTVDKDNIQEFRFRRVPFGVISSPFLLGATVQTHMDKYSTSFAQQVKDNIYVDNLITGTNTDGEAICFLQRSEINIQRSINELTRVDD